MKRARAEKGEKGEGVEERKENWGKKKRVVSETEDITRTTKCTLKQKVRGQEKKKIAG